MKENDMKTQNQPQTKGKSVGMKVLNTIINIMIVLVLVVSIIIATMALTSKANGISTIFGYTIQPIQSESMRGGSPDGYPGGDFGQGDLMIAKATDFDPAAGYEKGDIVTFRTVDSATNEYILIAHRIVDVATNESGAKVYQTQGDNRETSPVPDQQKPEEYISAASIGSLYYSSSYQGKILKGWGAPLDFIRTQKGFFLVVLLPMIIFFLYELIRVVINYMNYKKAKAEEDKDAAVKAAVSDALAGKQADNTESAYENMSDAEKEQFKAFLEQQKQNQNQNQVQDQTET
ncbi:hypothetical protein [Ruminococcus sp.]|uniref:hypothetical protein n=1 Tax=Ruminococcus sp. TaxID=41978 RepID=UPI0038901FE1